MTSTDTDDYRERLSSAASVHVQHETADYPELEPNKLFCLLLEKAFIEGASWHNLVIQQRMTAQMNELKTELREVFHAN